MPENKKDLSKYKIATLAGGCFWCMEAAYEPLDGVIEVISGFSGGNEANPTYEDVVYGKTGHYESVQIYYDPNLISYEEIIEFYWRNIDPTDSEGQFVDKGKHYRTAIFYANENEKAIAEASKLKLENSKMFDKPIVTEIRPFKSFYKAEEYHQDYYKKRTLNYKVYEKGSGRDQYKEKYWN